MVRLHHDRWPVHARSAHRANRYDFGDCVEARLEAGDDRTRALAAVGDFVGVVRTGLETPRETIARNPIEAAELRSSDTDGNADRSGILNRGKQSPDDAEHGGRRRRNVAAWRSSCQRLWSGERIHPEHRHDSDSVDGWRACAGGIVVAWHIADLSHLHSQPAKCRGRTYTDFPWCVSKK